MEPEGFQGPSTHSIVEEEAMRCGRYPFGPGGRTWLAKDQNGTLRIMGSRTRTPLAGVPGQYWLRAEAASVMFLEPQVQFPFPRNGKYSAGSSWLASPSILARQQDSTLKLCLPS